MISFEELRRLDQRLEIEPAKNIILPAHHPSTWGSGRFARMFGVQFPYMAGAMAQGIASVSMVEALAKEGFLASFGAAGLSLDRIESSIRALQTALPTNPFAVNLIHSPYEPEHEMGTAQLFVRLGVSIVEASAYLKISDALIYYRAKGLRVKPSGSIEIKHKIIAKFSRPELAKQFIAKADEKAVTRLLQRGLINSTEANLLAEVPLADSVIVEADSGGHTDNRPALTLFPSLVPYIQDLARTFKKQIPQGIPLGLAGGIATPAAVNAAFAMGADFVVTGSINQACVEAGTSDEVKAFLAEADVADTVMAPAADMFEMGVKVQVLKRKTMFPMRATKLYQLYQNHASFEAIPQEHQAFVEDVLLRKSFADAWQDTANYFMKKDPKEAERGARDAKHRMALVFRSYLGLSSKWAIEGNHERRADFQIWCGPAMAAFNQWTRGSHLAEAKERKVAVVAKQLLFGAGILRRLQSLKEFAGLDMQDFDRTWDQPRPASEQENLL